MSKGGRPAKHNWMDIKKHYESGMSQADIVLNFECPKSSLSERINKEGWTQNELIKDYIKGSVEVSEQKANLLDEDVRIVEIADNIIRETLRRKGLIFNAVERAIKKMDKVIEHGKVEEKVNVGDGIQRFEERKLNTTDIKNALDGYDKASITLGVNERFSNSQVNINNTNAQQTNIKSLDDFYE